jgi:hypothetical protein
MVRHQLLKPIIKRTLNDSAVALQTIHAVHHDIDNIIFLSQKWSVGWGYPCCSSALGPPLHEGIELRASTHRPQVCDSNCNDIVRYLTSTDPSYNLLDSNEHCSPRLGPQSVLLTLSRSWLPPTRSWFGGRSPASHCSSFSSHHCHMRFRWRPHQTS